MKDINQLADRVARVSAPAGSGGCSTVAPPPPPVSGTRTETVLEPAAGTAALRVPLCALCALCG